MDEVLPLPRMARRLGVTARWLRAEAEAGRVPSLRAGTHLLFNPAAVQRVIAARAGAAPGQTSAEESGQQQDGPEPEHPPVDGTPQPRNRSQPPPECAGPTGRGSDIEFGSSGGAVRGGSGSPGRRW